MIDFLKYKKMYYGFSLLFLIPGVFSLLRFGLLPSIDFTGGSLYEVSVASGSLLSQDEVAKTISETEDLKEVSLSSLQASGEHRFLLKLSPMSDGERVNLKETLSAKYGELEEIRSETVGPTVGRELIIKTLLAVVIPSVAIVLYIAWVFHAGLYGLAAVLAMFHDTLILLGIFSLLGHFIGMEVDALFVAAVLTILSFSVHDTIVVFDRIRENLKKFPHLGFDAIANQAITDTLVRSLNNSLTIIFMLLTLTFLGGTSIRWFVMALLVGTISGTYSSTFTAIPLLSTLQKRKKG